MKRLVIRIEHVPTDGWFAKISDELWEVSQTRTGAYGSILRRLAFLIETGKMEPMNFIQFLNLGTVGGMGSIGPLPGSNK